MAMAPPRTELSVAELAELNRRFESAPASEIIRWAVDTFHPHLCLTASMTDAVLIDLAVKVEPSIEVVFIDTGYHFPETLETVEMVRRRYGLNLRMMTVPAPRRGAVEGRPRELLLGHQGRPARPGAGRQGGVDERPAPGRGRPAPKRADHRPRPAGPGEGQPHRHLERPRRRRATSPTTTSPSTRWCTRATSSIGCWPCTHPVADGDDPRSGRWAGSDKTECGLHL